MSYLLITESPAKAKKIQGFLPNNYKVKSSCGHIVDLEKKKLSIDVDNDFKPTYKILSDKKDIVKELKNHSKDRNIILAADDDREGEAIAWHCANVLKVNLNENNRIIFREISKKAILKALENPIKVNINEVNAQQTRRIIDRLIGFKLSPCLWKHIQTKEIGLSAGRVQSALLNLLNNHNTMIDTYDPDYSLDIKAVFTDLKEVEFIFSKTYEIDNEFIKNLFRLFTKDRTFQVSQSNKTKDKSYPKKPFITSTLQQSAQNELGFNVKTTMDTAQRLYEAGHITYMRTDSTFISEEFQDKLNKHITEEFGTNYYQKANEKKVKGAQEAHEAIRPTQIDTVPDIDGIDLRLYNFIKKRTITSHMKPAEYDVYTIQLQNKLIKDIGYFTTKYKNLIFPGYLAYGKHNEGDNHSDKPSFKNEYILETCCSSEKQETKPQLYNESAVVKLLEDTGIGRPSTYANIIATLSNRKYTLQEDVKSDDREEDIIFLDKDDKISVRENIIPGKVQKKRIIITSLGKQVLEYLQTNFMNILNSEFTCLVEKDLDLIAKGKINSVDVIRKVYNSFIDTVDKQMGQQSQKSSLKCMGEIKGKTIYLGSGKYGPYLQIVTKDNEKKNMNIEKYLELIKKDKDTITFDECIQYLKYPKSITNDIKIYIGPYGYYMKYKGKNYKINQSGEYTKEYCLRVLKI
tara:strand:- start:1853 stop:3916 length:2064 start_codon:yes stop_codon:yes gene_type:complete